jgi:putative transposase
MIQTQIKLRLNTKQDAILTGWLWNLTGVWNWAVRKIELDAKDKVFHGAKDFQNLLANHGEKMGIPSHTLQGLLSQAHASRCFKKLAKKPRLKGKRNKLNSIPFPDPFRAPAGNHIAVPGLGKVRFHKQEIPEGKIKCGRIVKRASGWYLCLFVDAQREAIERIAHGQISIDPGFKSLLTTSDGEIIEHPRELEAGALRLAQAQRGNDKKLAARLQERIANRRKDRNHKLSLQLVAENDLIAFSADRHKGVANKFGKSVSSSSHYQLRQMLSYKSRAGGTKYVEVDSKFSTKTCSDCGSLSGPTGWDGLAVRQWRCPDCGSLHDRDTNAARNTLQAALGTSVEVLCARAAVWNPRPLGLGRFKLSFSTAALLT